MNRIVDGQIDFLAPFNPGARTVRINPESSTDYHWPFRAKSSNFLFSLNLSGQNGWHDTIPFKPLNTMGHNSIIILGKNYNRDTAQASSTSSSHASVHAYAKHAPVKQLVNSKLSSTAHHSSSPPPIKSSHSSSTLLSQGEL